MENLTFDQLPQAVCQLNKKLERIEGLLLQQSNPQLTEQADQWFDLNELVKYDPEKRTKPTFYGYVHNSTIPYHKRGKKLLFLKSEIDAWLKQGRKKTQDEIKTEAENYLSENKKG